jgi:dTMP kinase
MRYIAVEGIDGSGKSTLVNNLRDRLLDQDIPCAIVKEPDNEYIRNAIDFVKKSELRHEDEILTNLFAADRLILKDKIFNYLYEGVLVISDRSKYSSYAYQNTDLYYNTLLNQYTLDPHAVFYLDISPEIAEKRYLGEDKFENRALLTDVRGWYLNNLKPMVEDSDAIYVSLNVDNYQEDEVTDYFMGKVLSLIGDKVEQI